MRITGTILALAILSISINNSAHAAVMDVASMQAKTNGWVARDNWVNRLTKSEVQRMLGFPGKVRFNKELTVSPAVDLRHLGTEVVDWRSKDGQNWVTPVLNQGNCGSCVAYATVGTLETQMNVSRLAPFLNMRYSTDALFACGGGGCESGWYPDAAASFLQTTGVPDEACMPSLMSATGEDSSCSMKCSDSASRSQKISSINTPSNVDAVKAALRRGPLVTTLDVYADFIVYGSGVYKHTTGDYLGGHAISIIGFDDARRAWIIRNSWGPDWGDHGFAYVSYDDTSGVSDSTWGFEIPSIDGYVVARNLHDHDFLAGDVTINGVSTYSNTSKLTFDYNGPNNLRGGVSCASASCGLALLTSSLPDGRYEGVMTAQHDGKASVSDKRYFYVVNHKPDMKLSFSVKDGDVTKPLSGRVVFNVDAASAPVPLAALQLVVKQGDKVVYTKGADMVIPKMTMGWRTIFVPNGNYTISLKGTVAGYETESNSYNISVKN